MEIIAICTDKIFTQAIAFNILCNDIICYIKDQCTSYHKIIFTYLLQFCITLF